MNRSELQRACDRVDLDLFNAMENLRGLSVLIPNVGAELRHAAHEISKARGTVRKFMHPVDRDRTKGY